MTQTSPLPSGPSLSMDPTVHAVLITGPGLGDPVLRLTAGRPLAARVLREQAAEILTTVLEFTPLGVQEGADERTVIDTLAGYGFAATITEERVSL